MRTVIIDDEPDAVDSLELIIEEYLPQLAITNTFTEPKVALKKLPLIAPDLVFLDINMPGLNGFELLEKLDTVNFNIIFTTAYDEYAIKAFKFGAANYLLKPIDVEDLITAVNRIALKNESGNIVKTLKHLKSSSENKISVSSSDGIHYLKPDEIIFLFADHNITNIKLKNGKKIIVKKTLKDLETRLPDNFFRIHNSYVINVSYVKKLMKSDPSWQVEMDNTDTLPISRRKRSEFLHLMENITGNSID